MAVKEELDLSAADAVWVATALLHREHPSDAAFAVHTIVDKVQRLHQSSCRPMTIYQHVNQHCVANRPPNKARLRMLIETPEGLRRLYRNGDPVDPRRAGARALPEADVLGDRYKKLLDWYGKWSAGEASDHTSDPLLALMGTWTFGSANEYVRKVRDGWEGRP